MFLVNNLITVFHIFSLEAQNTYILLEQVIFWSMHILADQDHGDEGIEMVSDFAITGEQRKAVFDCTIETSRLFYDLWNLYTLR